MDEALYRQRQAVARLFGPAARLDGSIGTDRRQGELRIHLDGRTIGRGETFAAALAEATRQLATSGRAVAPAVAWLAIVLC